MLTRCKKELQIKGKKQISGRTTRSSTVAVIGDRTAWNNCGQRDNSLIYSLKLKSILSTPVSLLVDRCALWLNDTSYTREKVSEEVNMKCRTIGTRQYNF